MEDDKCTVARCRQEGEVRVLGRWYCSRHNEERLEKMYEEWLDSNEKESDEQSH